MMDWLGSWLRQLIAVVLLAGIIELLLPNKTMQRYVRLVAGLIILLTIMSPIIRLLQGDFNTKLNAGFDAWLNSSPATKYKMPTLQDIERDAESLKRSQQTVAGALTESRLAAAMKGEVERRTGLPVYSVNVKLEQSEAAGGPAIASVVVTLAGAEDRGGENGNGNASDGSKAVQPVEEVAPVTVTVEPEGGAEVGEDASGSGGQDAMEAFAPVEEGAASAIVRTLQEGWAVDPGTVTVRRTAESADGSGVRG